LNNAKIFEINSLSYLEFDDTDTDIDIPPKHIIVVQDEEYLALKLELLKDHTRHTVFHKLQEFFYSPNDYKIILYSCKKINNEYVMQAGKTVNKDTIKSKYLWFYDFAEKNMFNKYPEYFL